MGGACVSEKEKSKKTAPQVTFYLFIYLFELCHR